MAHLEIMLAMTGETGVIEVVVIDATEDEADRLVDRTVMRGTRMHTLRAAAIGTVNAKTDTAAVLVAEALAAVAEIVETENGTVIAARGEMVVAMTVAGPPDAIATCSMIAVATDEEIVEETVEEEIVEEIVEETVA